MMKKLGAAILIPGLLIVVTIMVVAIGRGWRFNFTEKELEQTGILVATSDPDGAQVYINGKFTAATNSNINLAPNWYDITISKDGFYDWTRKLRIQGEIVVKTDAFLFLKNPSLSPLIATGVETPMLAPDGTSIFYIASPSASTTNMGESQFEEQLQKPTLFMYDLVSRTTPFSKNPRPYEKTLAELLNEWETEQKTRTEVALRKFPKEFTRVASDSIRLISFSPDETKVLYTATDSAVLTRFINPPLLGARESEDVRTLTKSGVYVYDAKEDHNYDITEAVAGLFANYFVKVDTKKIQPVKSSRITPTLTPTVSPLVRFEQISKQNPPVFWLGTSGHLVLVEDKSISVMEYDGHNKIMVYSGPFVAEYVFPHPSGRQLIITTNFNPEVATIPSLYTLSIH